MKFNYNLTTNLVFGSGSGNQIGEEAAKLSKKIMIVTGGSSTKKSGLLQRAQDQLHTAGAEYVTYDKAQPNPVLSTVLEGAEIAKDAGCGCVIAIGGGSSIDTAKGICAAMKSKVSVKDMLYEGISVTEAIPLVAVPTTCGTGSEVNGIAVITDEENSHKLAIVGNAVIPKVSIVDPDLMKTMPKGVFASVAFDALCHLIEAYLSKGANFMTDALAMEGMRLLSDNLVKLYHDYDHAEAWEKVTFASTLGGYTLNGVGVIAGHGMEHPESGLKNVVHGQGLAAILPVLLKELAPCCPERIAAISRLFGGTDEYDCWKALLSLLRSINLDVTLADLGFNEKDIQWMKHNTFKVAAYNMMMTPKELDEEDVARLYTEALDFNRVN